MIQDELNHVKALAEDHAGEAFELLQKITSRELGVSEMCACAECYARDLKNRGHAVQCLERAELLFWWDIDALMEIARHHLALFSEFEGCAKPSRDAAMRCLLKAAVFSMMPDEEFLPLFGNVQPAEAATHMDETDWEFAENPNTRDTLKTLAKITSIIQLLKGS